MIQVGSVSSELRKEYLGMHELLQQLRQQLDITCSESKAELMSKVMEVAKRMTGLEEHTQKLHADWSGELTKVCRDMPNVVTNLLSSALQWCAEKLDNVAQELDHVKPSIQTVWRKSCRNTKGQLKLVRMKLLQLEDSVCNLTSTRRCHNLERITTRTRPSLANNFVILSTSSISCK